MSVSCGGKTYICPMHPRIRHGAAGRCFTCDMPLLPEGTRFALLRYMAASPRYLGFIGVALSALALIALVLLR